MTHRQKDILLRLIEEEIDQTQNDADTDENYIKELEDLAALIYERRTLL